MNATYDIDDDDDRKRFRRFLIASAVVHGVLLLLVALSPSFSPAPELPAAITVDLLAAPGLPPAAKASPAPKAPRPVPAPPSPPVAKAAPVPPPPAPPVEKPVPPPPPKAETVLPKEAVKAPEQVKPAPPPTKPTPAVPPQPAPAAKPAPPQKQASIDDVLSQMRAEAGESAPAPIEEASVAPADVGGTGGGGGSVKVSPEVMAWLKSARIHVRKSWVLVPGFRLEPLSTQVRVNLDAAGNVVGEAVIVRKSGNPWYDDSVLRAIQKASPLPAPPKAGEWVFLFQPEES